jgi:hypothetical protein
MTKTQAEIQQAALALNNEDQPFTVETTGNQIVGKWNILDAKWYGILSANSAEMDYTITIDLDEPSSTYVYVELSKSAESTIAVDKVHVEKDFLKGKQWGTHQAGIEIGFGMKNKDEPTQAVGAVTYNFSNARIKKPLLDILNDAGWKEKKSGFLKKLFK